MLPIAPLLSLLLATQDATTATPAPAPEPAAAAQSPAAAPAPASPAAPAGRAARASRVSSNSTTNKLICEESTEIGSRIAKKRVCMTAQEWRQLRADNRNQIMRAQGGRVGD